MFYFVAYTATDWTGGDNGLLDIPRHSLSLGGKTLIPLESPWQYYTFVAVIFLIVFAILLRVADSVFGRTLLAIRDNETRAAAIGYHVKTFKLVAFAISGAVTALAGALHALMTGIAPLSNIEYHTSEMILVMTVIGGTGSVWGPVVGTIIMTMASELLRELHHYEILVLGAVLILTMLFAPQGLVALPGAAARLLKRLRGRASEPAGVGLAS